MPTVPRASSRYLANKQFPITKTLYDIFEGSYHYSGRRERKREGDKFASDARNDIVSEKLCDDVIEYLAPTLEQHKGCTLIDVHPGACLWSTKLHNFLKPKRHLLMEPEKAYFEPFIKPLLDQPSSTYRHTGLAGAHPRGYWDNYRKVLSNPDLAPKQALPADDPRQRKLDTNFLFTGNLARQYKVYHRLTSVSFGSLILQQMVTAALGNEAFCQGGLVRMLWWVPESEKPTLFPTTEMFRHSLNTRLSTAATISEVAACTDVYNPENRKYASRRQRPDTLRAYTTSRVEHSMRDKGMELPEGRQFLYDRPQTDLTKIVSPLETSVNSVEDLEAEVASVRRRLGQVVKLKTRRVSHEPSKEEIDMLETLAFPQCVSAAEMFRGRGMRMQSLIAIADMGLRLVRLEVGLKVVEEKGVDSARLEEFRKEVLGFHDQLNEYLDDRATQLVVYHSQLIDQQIAVFMKPPLLALDARSYEPLRALEDEFWPTNQLMLLDMVPKSRDLSVPDLATPSDAAKVCNMLIKHINQAPAGILPDTLERIAPNAAKDLLPLVPAATDPRKGGRLNPHHIRNRMLSEEIIEGLVKAWIEWPFKPSDTDMLLAAEVESDVGAVEGPASPESVSEALSNEE